MATSSPKAPRTCPAPTSPVSPAGPPHTASSSTAPEAPANMPRPDLASLTGGSTAHGFIFNLSVPPGTHKIEVVAVESDTSSISETVLGVTAAATNPPPRGSIDVANRTQVVGWLF